MRAIPIGSFAILAGLLAPAHSQADTATDRIGLSASGSTLTDTSGGAGESLSWLHNFNADSLVTVGADHEKLADAQWTFGSISAALTRPIGDGRYTVAAEAHEGAGDDGPHAFHYSIAAADLTGTYFHRLSITLEDRRVDVETTHGNLPKLGLAFLWNPHWLTSLSFADTVSGNLGTRLYSARIDRYATAFDLLAGASFGQASPAVVDLQTGIVYPGHTLREGYVGITKSFAHVRSDVSLIADYLDLAGSKRATLTLNYIFHVQAPAGGH